MVGRFTLQMGNIQSSSDIYFMKTNVFLHVRDLHYVLTLHLNAILLVYL